MSGLDANNDVILEWATIVTDANLNIIAEGPQVIGISCKLTAAVLHSPERRNS
jgi:oligoribonuclease (3'-5' exoribonuclease)